MDHFTYHNGELHAESIPISTIAKAVGSPFYCYSKATFTRHFKVFSSHFEALNATVCFAVKANSNIHMLRLIAENGGGADVVSAGEIKRAIQAGIPADRIVFSGVAKTIAEMRYALEQHIWQFNIESEAELDQLNSVATEMNVKAPIAIRVNPDVDPKTHAKISTGQKESKFGIEMPIAETLYQKARTMEGIRIQGVSVHIGSQLLDLNPFRHAFERVRAFVEGLREAGIAVETIDLGGGFGIRYKDADATPELEEYAGIVKETIGDLGCRLILEPGRVIAGNAGILVSQVTYIKQGTNRQFLIIDAGMNDLVRPAMYGAHHDIVPVIEQKDTALTPYDVVGPICESSDIFAAERELPAMHPGDLLAIRSAGAYGAVMANSYNSRALIPEVLVDGDHCQVIRRRVSLEEMLEWEEAETPSLRMAANSSNAS